MRHIRLCVCVCVCKHQRPPPSPETKYLLWLVQMQARVREHHVRGADSDAVFVCGAGPEEHLCHQELVHLTLHPRTNQVTPPPPTTPATHTALY